MPSFKIVLSVAALVLVGCGSTPPKAMQDAVLTQASVETTKVINEAASRALNGAAVSLARDVFTKSSDMQIERMTQGPAAMPGLNGRMMGVPKIYKFSLKSKQDGCFLVYQKTGQAYPLKGVSCRVSMHRIENSKSFV